MLIRQAILLLSLLGCSRAVYFCKDDEVVESVVFEEQPRCPPPNKDSQTIINGTVYLFKPNLKQLEIPAYRCELRVTRVTTVNECGFWICSSDAVPHYQYFSRPVSADTCRRWIETKSCSECSGSKETCKLTRRSQGLYHTNAPIRIEEETTGFGTATWTGDSIDCQLTEGNVSSKRPWKKIVSSWGTLQGVDRQTTYQTKKFTLVWEREITHLDTCSYVLHSENGGFLRSFQRVKQLTVPQLQMMFTISSDIKNLYNAESHCLDANIARFQDAGVYALPGDMIAVFVAIDVDGEIAFQGDDGGKTIPLHGHVNGSGILTQIENYERAQVSRVRPKRDVASLIDAYANFNQAKSAYFTNLILNNQYQNAVDMVSRICEKSLQLFAIWKLQAEINPSAVVSHFLGRDVIVKREGNRYNILSCVAVSEYTVFPSLKKTSEKCYSRPLLLLDQNPDILFQLGQNNRIISPPVYFEKCLTRSKLTFQIDDKIYQFLDYSASANFSVDLEGVTVLGPNVQRYFNINRTFHEVKHYTLYSQEEISTSLIDNEEVLDFVNQEIRLLAKFGSPTIEKGQTEEAPLIVFFSEIMTNIIFFFNSPLAQTIALAFVTASALFNWYRIFYTCCHKKPLQIYENAQEEEDWATEENEGDRWPQPRNPDSSLHASSMTL